MTLSSAVICIVLFLWWLNSNNQINKETRSIRRENNESDRHFELISIEKEKAEIEQQRLAIDYPEIKVKRKVKNEVYLTGFLKYAEVFPTSNGGHRLKAKISVPFMYTDKDDGTKKEGNKYFKITACDSIAEDLGGLEEGTSVEVIGLLNERNYDPACIHSDNSEEEYWSDIVIHDFVVVVEA